MQVLTFCRWKIFFRDFYIFTVAGLKNLKNSVCVSLKCHSGPNTRGLLRLYVCSFSFLFFFSSLQSLIPNRQQLSLMIPAWPPQPLSLEWARLRLYNSHASYVSSHVAAIQLHHWLSTLCVDHQKIFSVLKLCLLHQVLASSLAPPARHHQIWNTDNAFKHGCWSHRHNCLGIGTDAVPSVHKLLRSWDREMNRGCFYEDDGGKGRGSGTTEERERRSVTVTNISSGSKLDWDLLPICQSFQPECGREA